MSEKRNSARRHLKCMHSSYSPVVAVVSTAVRSLHITAIAGVSLF